MKIGIIGLGVVGSAVYQGLLHIGQTLTYYDPKFAESKLENILDTECVFVCVPTPTIDGVCDTTTVTQVVDNLNQLQYQGIVAIKSTVIPGTTQNLQHQYPQLKICFVPEFLREKSALTDFVADQDVLIVGTNNSDVFDIIKRSHGSLPAKIQQVTPTEAELCKYFNNIFNALRIVFANGMFDVCEQLGADYQNVFNSITLRKTISKDYLRSSKALKNFSGSCLPKDTIAWAEFVKDLGLPNRIFSAIIEDNTK